MVVGVLVPAGFLEAFPGAGGAAAALCGHAQIPTQVLEVPRAIASSFLDLAFSNGKADTDVHCGRFPWLVGRGVKLALYENNSQPRYIGCQE